MKRPHIPVVLPAVWAIILAVLVTVMAPGLDGGFFFDDRLNILKNEHIRVQSLNLEALAASTQGMKAGALGRPVSVISFAMTHYVFGLSPYAFKAINLCIHALNGVLVFWLLRLFLRRWAEQPASRWLALWVAAAWLLHPINVTPVLMSVQRMTLLSATFLLLACIAHLKAFQPGQLKMPGWGWLAAGWLLFWPLSILSKENGLLFPLFVLAMAWFAPGVSRHGQRVVAWTAVALLVVVAAGMVYLGPDWLLRGYESRTFTPGERLMTEARVLWVYLLQTLLPNFRAFGLYHDYFPVSRSLLQPATTVLAILGWAAVVAAVLRYRRLWPLPCLGMAWFLVGHSMESSIIALELMFEHRNYLPSIGLILAAACVAYQSLEKMPQRRLATNLLVALLPLLFLAGITWLRAKQLGDPHYGPIAEATQHPRSARANHAAAQAIIANGRGDRNDPAGWELIRRYMLQSEAVEPTFKHGHLGLMGWACLTARPVEREWLDALSHQLEYAIFWPKDINLYYDIFKTLQVAPDCLRREDALRLFESGARNARLDAGMRAHFLIGATLYELKIGKNPGAAKAYLERALAIAPDDAELRRLLAGFTAFGAARSTEMRQE